MVRARGPASGLVEAAAKTDAMISPTGVAIANPTFASGSSTPGVARACSPRKPALARNAREIRTTPGVAITPGGDIREVRQDRIQRCRHEHEPEVAGMVFPHHVELRPREQDDESDQWQQEQR